MKFNKNSPLFKSNLAPQDFRILDAKKGEDIILFAKERGVHIVSVQKWENKHSKDGWNIHVQMEDYNPEFWSSSCWRVCALIEFS